jgi:hypothetical protein
MALVLRALGQGIDDQGPCDASRELNNGAG